jgi:hypothetical protein
VFTIAHCWILPEPLQISFTYYVPSLYSWLLILILSSCLCLWLSIGFFSWDFQEKKVCFSRFPVCLTSRSSPPLLIWLLLRVLQGARRASRAPFKFWLIIRALCYRHRKDQTTLAINQHQNIDTSFPSLIPITETKNIACWCKPPVNEQFAPA